MGSFTRQCAFRGNNLLWALNLRNLNLRKAYHRWNTIWLRRSSLSLLYIHSILDFIYLIQIELFSIFQFTFTRSVISWCVWTWQSESRLLYIHNCYLCFLKTQLNFAASDNEIIEPSNYCTAQIQYLGFKPSYITGTFVIDLETENWQL